MRSRNKEKRNKDDGSFDRYKHDLNILKKTKVFAFLVTAEIIECVIFFDAKKLS